MTANLQGIRFDQIYGDNSGTSDGQFEIDTDGDGTATQEDEFVSIINSNTTSMDISGWQIWSDSTGTNAPDQPQDGLYHTFPPGTVLQPGETLYIINEITGTPPDWAQEASEGGVESGAGGHRTDLLSEGNQGRASEAVALVDPSTGDYIVFNMSSDPPQIQTLDGFTGTQNVGTVDGDAIMPDQGAGTSFRFNSSTGSYETSSPAVPCFTRGTLIHTPTGRVPVEQLTPGDLVTVVGNRPQPIRWVGVQHLDEAKMRQQNQHPIEFRPGSLGPHRPERSLCVSPQNRFLINGHLMPARGLTQLPKVRVMQGCRRANYYHLLLDHHQVILAEGVETESLFPGRTFLSRCSLSDRLKILAISGDAPEPVRACLTVAQARQHIRGLRRRSAA